jgi:hypothetical protein
VSGRGERRRHRKQLGILHRAQGGLCAGCGETASLDDEVPANSPLQPTFDHYDPACFGGARTVRNGLLKHRHCNERRGAQLPNGCDMIWFWSVQAKLGGIHGWAPAGAERRRYAARRRRVKCSRD